MTALPLEPNPGTEVPLGQVASGLGHARVLGDALVRVRGVQQDSRKVAPGDLFVARKGEKADGLAYVQAAIERGAVAVLAQEDHTPSSLSVPLLVVDDIRVALGKAASVVYGDPTRALRVVGITGTNGKTTTSYLTRVAIDGAGGHAGVVGTLGTRFEGIDLGAAHTTPEADELMRMAAEVRAAGATHLVMEVSSHALAQHRADAVRYSVAAFTNLTQDHLDYHGTMEAYAQAKSRLFFDLAPAAAALMIDDPFGASLAARVRCPLVRVSCDRQGAADVRPASPLEHDARGIRCAVTTPSGLVSIASPLVGEHNLSNLLLALAIVQALGLDVARAAQALGSPIHVPGRLERCDTSDDDLVVLVDYAHTPDALQRALRAIRPLTSGQVHCVFGCGGDRDRAKRPIMGGVVASLADVAIVTHDNPRTEDPASIIEAILVGTANGKARVRVEPERERAIDLAVGEAAPGDVVLIAGKGHEPYQIIGTTIRHFDDREQARSALAKRRARREPGGA